MTLLDVVRVGGAVARLTRFVVVDDLFRWWVKDPIDQAMGEYREANTRIGFRDGQGVPPLVSFAEPWWWKYRDGLDCGWCSGFWIALGVLTAETAIPQEGMTRRVWNLVTGALALNWAVANTGGILGDYYTGDENA